jgi:Ca2+-binding RTX toxin-like protein
MSTITGTTGNDSLTGTTSADSIRGAAGDDTISGGSGNDSLWGDAGNDSIDGGAGADNYYFNVGDGNDTIVSSGGLLTSSADHLKFGPGISMADVDVTMESGVLVFRLKNGKDSVRVTNYSSGSDAGRLVVDFADGTTWDTATIARKTSPAPDNYLGTSGNDFYDAGGGDDLLYGDAGDDTLYGDAGRDLLIGDTGNNVYYYGMGDGEDILSINQTAVGVVQSDTLRLGAGITVADFDFVNDLGDLWLKLNGTNDSVRVLGLLADPTTYNFSITFMDGNKWDIATLMRKTQVTNDTYTGTSGNDFYDGGAGNDTINGGAGADSLYGDTGDDLIDGGAGADIIYFGRGDGRDTIVGSDANSPGDKVILSASIDVSDVIATHDGNDLLLTIRDTTDTLRLQNYFTTAQANRPVVQFSTGLTWTGATIDRKLTSAAGTIAGTTGDDWIDGTLANDTITGGTGNDTLYGDAGRDSLDGGAGADTYLFGRGDGQDTIVAGASSAGLVDSLRLGHGIAVSDLDLSASGNDLLVRIKGGTDSVLIQGYLSVATADRTRIDFVDGTKWDGTIVGRKLTSSNDSLTGTTGNDLLDGGLGNDTLIGSDGDDALYGDAGNDSMAGGLGHNSYYFGWGDGQDTITLSAMTSDVDQLDMINFGTGITMADVDVLNDNGDLVFDFHGTTDSLRVTGYFNASSTYVLSARFSDGTSWEDSALQSMTNASDDLLQGTSDIDYLNGGIGQDTLLGGTGNDTLYGDAGTDRLDGGAGMDTYLFGRGDGRDTVVVSGSDSNGDQVRFGADINISDLVIARVGNDLTASLRGTQDMVTLQGYYSAAIGDRPSLKFADGLVLNGAAIDHKLNSSGAGTTATAGDDWLDGSLASDTITGGAGDDFLYGDAGNDSLDGGAGMDTYLFGRGDGKDTVVAAAPTVSGQVDSVRFSRDIAMTDVTATVSGNDLLLTVTGGKDRDSVLVQNYFSLAAADRPRIDFTAGGSWDAAAVTRNTTSSNDTLTGTANADVLDGGLGNDVITGGAGDDTLFGNAGNDSMDGGAGVDTYFFGRGDGVDHILDGTAADRRSDVLQLGAGITMADVDVALEGTALAISLRGSTDKIYIDNYTGTASTDRMAVRFADGSTWRGPDIDSKLSGIDDGLWGNATPETLDGGAGNDVIAGVEGDDSMYGGTGNDWMGGGQGSDTYFFGLGDGQDTVSSDGSDVAGTQDRLIFGAQINPADVTASLSGTQDLLLTVGSNGDSVLVLGYYARAAADRLSVQFANGYAWDSATVDRQVTASDDVLSGTTGEDLVDGGLGNDSILGLAGDDYLVGGAGLDTLDGGAGADTMLGGANDDTYIVDNVNDVVIEKVEDGILSYDTIESSVSYTAPDNIEALTLTGTANINGTANSTGCDLTGNEGNNYLKGGDGLDFIFGGGGADTLDGGLGDDYYYLTDNLSTVVEQANGGLDQIWAYGDGIKMADNVERLYMQSYLARTAYGNDGKNYMMGNNRDNTLYGYGGNDQLFGLGGNDTFYGGLGNDTLYGGGGNDVYHFQRGDGADTILDSDGTAGNKDTLDLDGAINANQVWFAKSGSNLVISVIGTTDQVTISNWYIGPVYQVESFVAAGNGKTLSSDKVQGLVDAMAAFTPPAQGQTTLPANYDAALSGIIASSWT